MQGHGKVVKKMTKDRERMDQKEELKKELKDIE